MFSPFRLAITKFLIKHNVKNVTYFCLVWELIQILGEQFDDVCQKKKKCSKLDSAILPGIQYKCAQRNAHKFISALFVIAYIQGQFVFIKQPGELSLKRIRLYELKCKQHRDIVLNEKVRYRRVFRRMASVLKDIYSSLCLLRKSHGRHKRSSICGCIWDEKWESR